MGTTYSSNLETLREFSSQCRMVVGPGEECVGHTLPSLLHPDTLVHTHCGAAASAPGDIHGDTPLQICQQ